jgi:hypothetical protein
LTEGHGFVAAAQVALTDRDLQLLVELALADRGGFEDDAA